MVRHKDMEPMARNRARREKDMLIILQRFHGRFHLFLRDFIDIDKTKTSKPYQILSSFAISKITARSECR